MKLSEKQKQVIGLMREDYSLSVNVLGGYYEPKMLKTNSLPKHPRMNTVKALLKRKLIDHSPNKTFGTHHYQLTELGRTIELTKQAA